MPDPAARSLVAGDITAVFLPDLGMLGASLRHRGEELLGRIDDLAGAAAAGSAAGIPLLHPWANRLEGPQYRAAGKEVTLDLSSPLLHVDSNGLPIHGVPWSRLRWDVVDERADRLCARLDWRRSELLALFPFEHRLEMTVSVDEAGVTIQTTLLAGENGAVPVSFGFHPYFRIPGVARPAWRLELPEMRRLQLDERGVPTGVDERFAAFAGPLEDLTFDDGFTALPESPSFVLAGGGRRLAVTFVAGYPYAQVFAPRGTDAVAFEPMTAPTNALASGRGLRLVAPQKTFRSAFRVDVQDV